MNLYSHHSLINRFIHETFPFIISLLSQYPTELQIQLNCLSCIVSSCKEIITFPIEIERLQQIIHNLPLKEKQVINKIIQIYLAISTNKQLSNKWITEETIEYLLSIGKQCIHLKDIQINLLSCFINYSCQTKLHKYVVIEKVFTLLSEILSLHKYHSQVCLQVMNLLYNFSTEKSSRKLMIQFGYYQLLLSYLAYSQQENQMNQRKIQPECIRIICQILFTLSMEQKLTSQQVNELLETQFISSCKEILEMCVQSDIESSEILLSIITFLNELCLFDQCKSIIKKE